MGIANEDALRQFAQDTFLNMPAWASRWVGSYLGVVLRVQTMAIAMGWRDCTLSDVGDLVKEVFKGAGLTLDCNVRLRDGAGNHIPLGIWNDGSIT